MAKVSYANLKLKLNQPSNVMDFNDRKLMLFNTFLLKINMI